MIGEEAEEERVEEEGFLHLEDPREVARGAERDRDPHQDRQRLAVQLDAFEPGEYELRLVVIDRNARTSAKRAVNFTVE